MHAALRHKVARLEAELKLARDFAAGAQRRFLATAKQRCARMCMCMWVGGWKGRGWGRWVGGGISMS